MAVTLQIEHGNRPGFGIDNETGLLTKSVSIKAERDYVESKGSERAIVYVRGENPRLMFDISGTIIPNGSGLATGIAAAHPGNAVTLLNFTGSDSVHGFNAADNKLIVCKDATQDRSDEEEPQCSVNCQLYPAIAA